MDILDSLNPQQIKAVTAPPGPVLVLAGPGSGKTRVLTHRAAYLIGNQGIQPYQVMAVTFTNKAASEMRERISALIGQDTHNLTLGTFHATCARILRIESDHLPVNSNYVIFDADDQVKVVRQVIQDQKLDEKRYRPHSVHASISAAKNELYLPEDFPIQTYREEIVARVYQQYQKILLASNALDFDDLLLWMALLLSDNEGIRDKYAQRFHHILVDEFQDTNMAQYSLLKHLASHHRNLFVVGDSDQSIYRWRGADYRNVRRFEEDFSDLEVILLEQNYRSTQNILDTAMSIIDRNTHRTPKKLFTERGAGEKIFIRETYDEREQAQSVVDTIIQQIAGKKAAASEFAVMYRTNAQSRLVEEAFLSVNLPYKLVGAQRFYGRREVKDIIAYLRLVVNPEDIFSLSRVINTPSRKIGTKTFAELITIAQKNGISPSDLLLKLAEENPPDLDSFTKAGGSRLLGFGRLLLKWRGEYESIPPVEILDLILSDIDYRSYIEDGSEEGYDRWENIIELRRLASEYQTVGLLSFLEDVALVSDQDTLDSTLEVPTLLTLHAAKGLEFGTVFIIGLNEGILPHQRSFDEPEAMEEERRLFYVGITRAKDGLYLFHSLNRYSYGYFEPMEASRYYRDIPPDLRAEDNLPQYSPTPRKSPQIVQSWKHIQKESPRADKLEPQYHPGQKIKHAKWGEGLVLNSVLQDDDEIVDIFFEGVGKKKLIASLADLKIIGS
ncbi:MAG: UvrD-helicase domain-containing protein [Anaerolineales bacterium]|nr:UvrD-helicase domain-containing protein [Anaerolineales bacterium]